MALENREDITVWKDGDWTPSNAKSMSEQELKFQKFIQIRDATPAENATNAEIAYAWATEHSDKPLDELVARLREGLGFRSSPYASTFQEVGE